VYVAKWLTLLASGLVAVSATAGVFDLRLSDERAADLHRVAVVSLLGTRLHGRKVGLTMFQNAAFDAEVPGWNVDATAAESLRAMAAEDARLHEVDVLQPDAATLQASFGGDEERADLRPNALLAYAAARGFDGLLLIHRGWNENEPFAVPGLTLLNRRIPGVNRTVACIAGFVRLYATHSGKQLAAAGGDETCSTRSIDAGWRQSWDAYTPEEQAHIETVFLAAIDLRIRMALTDMRIGAGADQRP
jgi:hypothetical protein